MSALVISSPYSSTRGRKPTRPAFLFDLHNDAAGGAAIVDRFGNHPDLTMAGTIGTLWTASRGFAQPNGTTHQAVNAATAYGSQDVMGSALLTPGQGLIVGWRLGWPSAKGSTSEIVLCLGRSNANSAALILGHSSSGQIETQHRGTGASATTYNTFGTGATYTTGAPHNVLLHFAAITGGFEITAWLNGVSIGTLQSEVWSANSGATPALSAFAAPDGITLLASRVGADPNAPTWSQRMGATNSAGTIVSNILALNLAQANISTAADLALELHQYPRFVGEILAAL